MRRIARREEHSTRTILVAAVAAILGACASSLPSRHYQFALSAHDARTPATWSAQPLPSHGRIVFSGYPSEESALRQAAYVVLRFGDPAGSLPLAALVLQDPGCNGAYSFSLEYKKRSSTSAIEYFDRQLSWGAPLKIVVEWWSNGDLEIDIADIGKRRVYLPDAVDRIQIRVLSGGLDVQDLDYQNLRSS